MTLGCDGTVMTVTFGERVAELAPVSLPWLVVVPVVEEAEMPVPVKEAGTLAITTSTLAFAPLASVVTELSVTTPVALV
jgi:hypothetical protein